MGDNDLEVDVQDFCFKQMCKLQIFNPPSDLITDVVNLIVTSNKFGKIYAAAMTEIKAIDVSVIEALAEKEDADVTQIASNFGHKTLDTRKNIKHIGLSCDDLTISVVFQENNNLCIGCLDARCFEKTDLSELFFATGRLSSEADVYVRELEWNPEDPDLAIVCFSNGIISLIKIDNHSVNIVASLPNSNKFYSVNWSPRGKNFASGRDDGKIMLYDKKLTLKKELACPEELTATPHRVVQVRWIMSHNFAAVYHNAEGDEPPKFVCIVNQKDGPSAYMNMEDIYFGFNEERKLCFFIETIPAWNILVTMASNAFEAVVVGKIQNKWVRWTLNDDSRAEMPLSEDGDETFPCGIAINRNSALIIREGEKTLPPMPVFLMISTNGVLCAFQMVNKLQDVKHEILVKPTSMTLDGMRMPVSSQNGGQLSEATAASLSGLPKPFKASTLESSSGSAQSKTSQSVSTTINQPTSFSLPKPSSSSSLPATHGSSFLTGGLGLVNQATKQEPSPAASQSSKTSATFPPTSSQASESKPALIFGNAAKETLAARNKENAPGISSTAPAKPFDFSSKTSLFAPPSASSNPLFGFSTTVSAAPQPSKVQDPQPTQVTSLFTTLRQPAVQSQPGVSVSLQSQQTALPKSSSLLAGSSTVSVSSTFVTSGNKNALLNREAGEKKEVEAQQRIPAGRVPPESRLLQSSPAARPVQESAQQRVAPALDQSQQQVKLKPSEDVSKPPAIKTLSKVESMSQELGSEITKSIKEEIKSFAKELSSLKADIAECTELMNSIGTEGEMISLQVKTNKCSKKLQEFQACHKEHRTECSQLKNKMMRSFNTLEEARVQNAGAHDPLFRNLLKARALDPVAARQQKELRSQINYISALISDVNESLEMKMDEAKANSSRRLKSNNIHNIYITMESIDKIIDNLASKIESISLKGENEELLSHHSTFRKSFLSESKLMENEESLSFKANSRKIADGKLRLSPMKETQLNSFLKKRGPAPVVRSSYKEPSMVVTPRAASTPAVSQSSRRKFESPSGSVSANLKLESLDESVIEKDPQINEEKQPFPLKSTITAAKMETPLAFGIKNKPAEEKPKVQPGYVFQQNAASLQKSAVPFTFGSASSFKVNDKGHSQLNQSKITTSQVSTNAFELKKEDKASYPDILRKESDVNKTVAFASGNTNPLLQFSTKPSFSEERRTELIPASTSSTVEYKQSPFAPQLTTTPVFGTSISSAHNDIPASASSFPTTSAVFSGSSVFAKPKIAATSGSQSMTTSSATSSFQFSSSSSTGDVTKQDQKSKDLPDSLPIQKSLSAEIPKMGAPLFTSKPLANAPSIVTSLSKESSSLFVSQPLGFGTETTQEKGTSQISTVTVAKTSSSVLFGNATEFSSGPNTTTSENSSNLFNATPITTPLFGGQSSLASSKTSTTMNPSITKQSLFGQAEANSGLPLSDEKTGLSTKSFLPPTESISKMTASSFSLPASTVAVTAVTTPSLDSQVTDSTSTVWVTTSPSISSLSGGQTAPFAPAISSLGSKVSVTTPLFGGIGTATVSSLSTNSSSDAITSSAFPTKTSQSSGGLFSTNFNATSSSAFGSQASLFATKTTQSSTGSVAATVSSKSSLFGVPSSSVETSVGVGNKSSEGTSGLFGIASTVTSTLSSFPTQATTTSSGILGVASTSSSSLFGAQKTTTTTSSGIFGQTVSSVPILFGNQQTSISFTTQQAEVKPFGMFSTPATSQNTGGLFTPQSSGITGSVFGNVSSTQTLFGQTSSPFGSQQTSSNSSGMGLGGFGLGGKPTNDPSKNPFGSVPSSSSAAGGSSNLFGPSSSSSPGLSSSQPTSQATKGSFSKGFGTGFMGGSASTQSSFGSSATAFGSGATFGGAPAFGSTPSFGGSPTFGSTSAFGTSASTGSTFGSGTSTFGQTSGFGALAQQAGPSFGALSTQAGGPTFGGLNATQNQMGFGNLAQQGSAFGQSGTVFGQSSSPKGSSFSSWR